MEDIENARYGAIRCTNIINEMKDFEDFIQKHTDLYSINLKEIFLPLIDKYPQTSISITGNASVMANISLSSVFDNIINNAITHSGCSQITISITKQKKDCKISIADNGTGIKDEIKEQIFDKYFHFGKTGNTGLGLYIVKEAVTNMGGIISIKNNIPTGTILTIILQSGIE